MQALEFGIAQYEPVVGVPDDESFRNRLDRIAEPHLRGGTLLGEALLLGDVYRDADEVRMGLAGIAHKLTARAQPDPGAARMAHAEHAVDAGIARVGELRGELIKLDVVRMN